MRIAAGIALLFVFASGAFAQEKKKETPKDENSVCWIELLDRSVVKGVRVILSDIAKVDAVEEADRVRLARLEVGRLGATGDVLRLRKDSVLRLVNDAGFRGPAVMMSGADTVEVRTEGAVVEPAEIESLAKKHIAKALEGRSGVISIAPSQPLAPIEVPAAKFRTDFKIEPDQKNRVYAGLVNLTLVVIVDGEIAGRWPVAMYVRRNAEVVVVKKRVAPGQKVSSEDLAIENREITRLPGDVFESTDEAIGMIASSGLAPGQLLLRRELRQTPVLRRGGAVVAKLKTGRIQMETTARAMEDGAVGERILIENLESKRTFYAIVLDSKTVEVEL